MSTKRKKTLQAALVIQGILQVGGLAVFPTPVKAVDPGLIIAATNVAVGAVQCFASVFFASKEKNHSSSVTENSHHKKEKHVYFPYLHHAKATFVEPLTTESFAQVVSEGMLMDVKIGEHLHMVVFEDPNHVLPVAQKISKKNLNPEIFDSLYPVIYAQTENEVEVRASLHKCVERLNKGLVKSKNSHNGLFLTKTGKMVYKIEETYFTVVSDLEVQKEKPLEFLSANNLSSNMSKKINKTSDLLVNNMMSSIAA
jgi:hypothetical protein